MDKNRKFPSSDRAIDLIVFLAILTAGVVLTVLGVPAGSIAGIAAALAALYGAWTSTRERQPLPPDDPVPDDDPSADDRVATWPDSTATPSSSGQRDDPEERPRYCNGACRD
ncbi:hypothetical protein [Streptomyces sp. NPDC056132]|uniref:hypothetical protein n=1 Tax=Streptomyces sp. NPDC056132 TaxID=3345722 RepID=UPI0035DE1783